jgi:hypothetical protein
LTDPVAGLVAELFYWFGLVVAGAFVRVVVVMRGGSRKLAWMAALGVVIALSIVGLAFGFW